jgi:hypothetical protein
LALAGVGGHEVAGTVELAVVSWIDFTLTTIASIEIDEDVATGLSVSSIVDPD